MDLETLFQRFVDHKIHESMIKSLSDTELSAMGVSTIGDRIRLRRKLDSLLSVGPSTSAAGRSSQTTDADPDQKYTGLPEVQTILSDILNRTTTENRGSFVGPDQLLLFSYMRSGSTVTGNLLRDSPNTFYMFEPLSPLAPYQYLTVDSICEMRNMTCRKSPASVEVALQALTDLFNCNFRSVPYQLIERMAWENKSSKALDEFSTCHVRALRQHADSCINNTLQRHQEKCKNPKFCSRDQEMRLDETLKQEISLCNKTYIRDLYESDELRRCYSSLETSCRKSEMVAAKVLRLGFDNINYLLQNLPKLKVLYLRRDPRGIMNSRIKTKWFPVYATKPENVQDNVISLCTKMKYDLEIYTGIKSSFEDRLTEITLETLTQNKYKLIEVFKFINKRISETEMKNIQQYERESHTRNTTSKWVNELSEPYRRFIEEHCSKHLMDSEHNEQMGK